MEILGLWKLHNLESKDKLSFMTSLLPYSMPKLSAVAADAEITNKLESMNEQNNREVLMRN